MALLPLQKRTMALAGMVLTTYLLLHMLANLSFFSASHFNAIYKIYNQPWLRWPLLLIVTAALLVHVRAAVTIRIRNGQARRQGYRKHDKLHIPAALVSLSIAFLLLFIVVHIGQSLLIDINRVRDEVMTWFVSPMTLLFYLAGLLVLAMHLQHALINVLQTLGISSKTYRAGIVSAVVLLAIGFAAIPLYIFGEIA